MTFQELREALITQIDVNEPFQDNDLTTANVDDIASQLTHVLSDARGEAPDALARLRELRGVGTPGRRR